MSLKPIVSPNLSRGQTIGKSAVSEKGGIVVAQNRLAAEIGARVLKRGGNAMDAALATSFAIGVLEPWMSGIGGIGGIVVREANGETFAVDAGAKSPAALKREDFAIVEGSDGDLFGWPNVVGNRNVTGATSICSPALVAGLAAAHERCGSVAWAHLVEPAIALARDGAVVDYHTTYWIAHDMHRLAHDPGSRAWFLRNGYPPATPAAASGKHTRLPVPVLAQTLERIARDGARGLYEGDIAAAMVADIQAAGGYLSLADLADTAPALEAPATQSYRGYTMHCLPELNGGITVGMAMRHAEAAFRPDGHAPDTRAVLAYTEALLSAFDYRFKRLGDGADRAMPSCTTHISVVDRNGMAVSLTQTLLTSFGSAFVSPATGVLFNNGINWFDPRPDRPNSLAPAKRALGNFAPAIFTGPDDVIAIGGSGGRKIIPAVFQAMAHIADFGVSLEDAIAGPRVDVSDPPTVVADERLLPETLAALGEAHPTIVARRIGMPAHFTILGATQRKAGMNVGMAEPHHPWADAVGESEVEG